MLYLLAGFAGHIFQAVLGPVCYASSPTLGASGCIMGVLGAYWYIFPWSKVCMFSFFSALGFGVKEVAATWVITAYFLLDLANGLISRGMDSPGGIANFAHVGGALVGAILVWALKVKRDCREISTVKAVQTEVRDVSLLGLSELKTLAEACPEDEELIAKLAHKAKDFGSLDDIRDALCINPRVVVTRCPEAAVRYLLSVPVRSNVFLASDFIYLGKWCEARKRPDEALRIYGFVETEHSDAPELEIALYRMASIHWYFEWDASKALEKLDKLQSLYPRGATMLEAEDLRGEIHRRSARAA